MQRSISENAAKLYEQVVKDLQYSQQVKDWAETYSKMDAKNAAAITTGYADKICKNREFVPEGKMDDRLFFL